MKTTRLIVLGVAAGAALALTGYAQTATNASFQKAGNIIGKDVQHQQQKIGTVRNLVVDLESGHILYAVVGLGGGDRVAVPPQEFRLGNNVLISRAGKQQMESAPKYQGGNSSPPSDANYVNSVYQHFGQPAWWAGAAGPTAGSFHNVHTVKELPGTQVINVDNSPVGKVNNVIVDLPAGQIGYITLDVNSNLGAANDQLYALPPSALTLASNQKDLVTDMTKERLSGAPHFSRNSWPSPSDMSFASAVYQYYGKQAWFENGGALQPTGRDENQNQWNSENHQNRWGNNNNRQKGWERGNRGWNGNNWNNNGNSGGNNNAGNQGWWQ